MSSEERERGLAQWRKELDEVVNFSELKHTYGYDDETYAVHAVEIAVYDIQCTREWLKLDYQRLIRKAKLFIEGVIAFVVGAGAARLLHWPMPLVVGGEVSVFWMIWSISSRLLDFFITLAPRKLWTDLMIDGELRAQLILENSFPRYPLAGPVAPMPVCRQRQSRIHAEEALAALRDRTAKQPQ